MVFIMKPLGSIESASDGVLKDARKLLERLHGHAVHEPITVAEAIKSLKYIRQEIYESLNQIQHEYLTIQAAKWLQINDPILVGASWLWNPRQTGGYNEPDLAVVRQEVCLISAEVTTSRDPVGLIDSRMRDTLVKLSQMQGKKFYFVPTEKMKRRAQTKVSKSGWDINIVVIKDEESTS
jgi:hypothetical protein